MNNNVSTNLRQREEVKELTDINTQVLKNLKKNTEGIKILGTMLDFLK